ncbi:MAG: MarR family winged helix-turn-helix transcriptional regulator [Marinomonas sp.]
MKSIQELFSQTPFIRDSHTPGTSLVLHVSNRLSYLLVVEIERLLKDNSCLNLASWRALRGLSEIGSSSQKELVKFANIDQGQISRALNDLEKKGFVSAQPSERDRRIRIFSITTQGESYREKLSPIIDGFHQKLNQALTDEELESFLTASAKIAAIVSPKS